MPFPIHAAALPNSLAGRDVLGRGRTGSGKTLAFGLPLPARTAGRRAEPRQPPALVLVPTRELAQQVTDAREPFRTPELPTLPELFDECRMVRAGGELDHRGIDLVMLGGGVLGRFPACTSAQDAWRGAPTAERDAARAPTSTRTADGEAR